MFDTFEKGILKFKKVIKYQQLRQLITLSFGPSSERMETCP